MLLWIDGFENYGTSGNVSPTGVMGRKYAYANPAGSYCGISTGRLGGYSLYWAYVDGSVYFQTPSLTTDEMLIIGLAIKFPKFWDTSAFMTLMDGATGGVNFRLTSAGEITIYRSGTLLGTTSGGLIKAGCWQYFEFKVLCNSTTGMYEILLGGVSIGSASGINTKNGTHNYHDAVRIAAVSLDYTYYDDFYICDSSGAANNDFLGNMKVVTMRPNASGDSSDFTPSAGDNYACVDEQIANDDTDYVEDDTTDQKDLYNYEATTLAEVYGVQVCTDCRETDATDYSIVTVCKSGVTEDDDVAQSIGSTSYVTKRRILETDPNTSAAWDPTDLNAAQFGVKVG